jgi:hypothetical protein
MTEAEVETMAVPERLEGSVRVADDEALRRLFAQPLDFGCRPSAIREEGGGYTVPVIGSPQALEDLRKLGFELSVLDPPPERTTDVGTGDRFNGGKIVPRGFGQKVGGGGAT